ncbi:MAG: hypothetical protein ACXWQZ_03090 [Ktedonobacterales bacterium]
MALRSVRHLIQHLDSTGDHHQFAQYADRFGNDLESAWAGTENGADLLWLAAAVGVEPKKIITLACDLLEGVWNLVETAGQETTQVIEAVRAWQRGEQQAGDVERASWAAYSLIARMGTDHPLPRDAEEVADAAVWLAYLVRDMPLQTPPDPAEHDDVNWSDSAWMVVGCLAQAVACKLCFDDSLPGTRKEAFDEAMHRFAIIVREHISGGEVQAAAQQRGVWSLS